VRQGLWDAIGPVRERGFPVKWVRPEALHLTLKFLGDVDDAREADLRAALGQVGGGPATLHIEGFGVFPDFTRPRVVWAGVTPDPALELLQHRVEQVFAPLGFPTEAKAFRPHLTLGRAKRDARPSDFTGLEAALGTIAFLETVVVPDVDLMESTLQSGGAVYQVKHRGRLS
jgi:RNA 2',3'-cyclic 3'-phosphodiesterase